MTKELKLKFDFLFWFIILLPTFYLAGKDLRHIQMNFFQFSIFFIVALFHVNKWIGCFLAWCTFQLMFFHEVPKSSTLIPNLVFAAILYHYIVKYVSLKKKYFWAFLGVLILNVAWIPLQAFNKDPIFGIADSHLQSIFSEYSGFFGLPAFMGNYAASVLPFAFLTMWWPILFVAIAIFYSKSTFSILAALGGSLFYFWFYKRIVFWGVLLFGTILASIYIVKYDLPTGQFQRRFHGWYGILRESFQSQFFGHGIGTYGSVYTFVETGPSLKNYVIRNDVQFLNVLAKEATEQNKPAAMEYLKTVAQNPSIMQNSKDFENNLRMNGIFYHTWGQAHNEFIQSFFETGAVGIFIIISYIVNILRRSVKHIRNNLKDRYTLALASSFISIVIVSIAHFPFHLARLAGPYLVIMALLEASLIRSEE